MVFKGFRSNNWITASFITTAGWVAAWEWCGAFHEIFASALFPQVMGKYDAGVVHGVNERGNRQAFRIKVGRDSQAPDYSKYMEE